MHDCSTVALEKIYYTILKNSSEHYTSTCIIVYSSRASRARACARAWRAWLALWRDGRRAGV
eukprot:COSAG02_NODE_25990_length_643_cov_53.235294_1_plen_61_part_10